LEFLRSFQKKKTGPPPRTGVVEDRFFLHLFFPPLPWLDAFSLHITVKTLVSLSTPPPPLSEKSRFLFSIYSRSGCPWRDLREVRSPSLLLRPLLSVHLSCYPFPLRTLGRSFFPGSRTRFFFLETRSSPPPLDRLRLE